MVNDRPVVSFVCAWSGALMQVSGWAYVGATAGSSLIIGQPGIWSAGGRLIIVVRVRPHCPRSLARPHVDVNMPG